MIRITKAKLGKKKSPKKKRETKTFNQGEREKTVVIIIDLSFFPFYFKNFMRIF